MKTRKIKVENINFSQVEMRFISQMIICAMERQFFYQLVAKRMSSTMTEKLHIQQIPMQLLLKITI